MRSTTSACKSPRARSTASSARTAPARPRCSTSSTASSRRMPAASASPARSWSGLKPHEVCRRGIGRTFQVVRAFPRMTRAGERGRRRLCRRGHRGRGRASWRSRRLTRVGLTGEHGHVAAGGLTTKQLRLMELARALAPRPRLLLLDETLAGLGARCDRRDAGRHPPAQPRRRHDRHHRAHHARDGEARRPVRACSTTAG